MGDRINAFKDSMDNLFSLPEFKKEVHGNKKTVITKNNLIGAAKLISYPIIIPLTIGTLFNEARKLYSAPKESPTLDDRVSVVSEDSEPLNTSTQSEAKKVEEVSKEALPKNDESRKRTAFSSSSPTSSEYNSTPEDDSKGKRTETRNKGPNTSGE